MRIYLTGEMCVIQSGRRIRPEAFPRRQGRLVFAYLVWERSRPVAAEELMELLWPQRGPASREVALSAVVSKLRALLGRDVIERAAGGYVLRLADDSWIDTNAAHVALHEAEAILDQDFRQAYGHAVVAAAILRRPFLNEDSSDWAERRRDELRGLLVRTLDVLAEIHRQNVELPLAIRAAQQAIAIEPLRESGYRRLMALHIGNDDRGAAKAVLEQCRRVLAAELSVEPSLETVSVLR